MVFNEQLHDRYSERWKMMNEIKAETKEVRSQTTREAKKGEKGIGIPDQWHHQEDSIHGQFRPLISSTANTGMAGHSIQTEGILL